jgi:uncharacterized oxidoreductase
MNKTGNTILVTGATSGIGLAFAKHFLSEGNKVIICGRRAKLLEKIKAEYPSVITRVCDVSKQKDREELCQWAVAEHPALNMLVNNAGIQLAIDMTLPVDMSDVREEMEVNFFAPLHLSSMLAAHLQTRPNAAIINVSSGLAFVPIAYMPVYCATKAALHSLTLSLRHQLRNTAIKVFEVIPPSVDTELGHQNRVDKTQMHGGMPVDEFVSEAIKELHDGILEAPIGAAKGLYMKRESVFDMLNKH